MAVQQHGVQVKPVQRRLGLSLAHATPGCAVQALLRPAPPPPLEAATTPPEAVTPPTLPPPPPPQRGYMLSGKPWVCSRASGTALTTARVLWQANRPSSWPLASYTIFLTICTSPTFARSWSPISALTLQPLKTRWLTSLPPSGGGRHVAPAPTCFRWSWMWRPSRQAGALAAAPVWSAGAASGSGSGNPAALHAEPEPALDFDMDSGFAHFSDVLFLRLVSSRPSRHKTLPLPRAQSKRLAASDMCVSLHKAVASPEALHVSFEP